MTSEPASPREAFVWIWLHEAVEPVVAGRLVAEGSEIGFVYGRSYRARTDAIRDAAPDAWGRRVILNRMFGARREEVDQTQLDELTFFLASGSDRTGALDFQASASTYVARGAPGTLEELVLSAERVEQGVPLTPELDAALHDGSSIGGARPKAQITAGNVKYIAKFSSRGDTHDIVRGEYIAMRLAAMVGLDVAPVRLERASGRDVLLVERFDRSQREGGWARRAMVSGLTILALDEMAARYASYQDLAEQIRIRFAEVPLTLRELFGRMTFNVLVGNVDDHARNHSAFWDGHRLRLTPAYDICPQNRAGEEASQAMLIHDDVRASRLSACIVAAPHFHLSEAEAIALIQGQVRVVGENWRCLCEEAELGDIDRRYFWGRQFLNPFAFYDLPAAADGLAALADGYRAGKA